MCPAITTPQIQQIFSCLLRNPKPTFAQIARQVSDVLRRNEESRIYSYRKKTGGYPPPRPLAEAG
jgi:hypothetical protein